MQKTPYVGPNPPGGSTWQPPAGTAGIPSSLPAGSVSASTTGYQPYEQPVPGNIASAPPLDQMSPIPGYDDVLLQGGELAPPTYEESMTARVPPERQSFTNFPTLSEERAREALLEEVSHHCCYGKTAAQELDIVGLVPNVAVHYILESFTETRATKWTVEPYQGLPIDGPYNGTPPTPWQVEVHPQQNFKDSVAYVEVPHTATVKPCHICAGTGRGVCTRCSGTSRVRCHKCEGQGNTRVDENGQQFLRPCQECNGTGYKLCTLCHGSGSSICSTCAGRAQLKCYIKLTVTWKVHTDEEVFMETGLPRKCVMKARGVTAFEEEAPLVYPINHFPDATVNRTSQTLVNAHRSRWPNEKILLQRQVVRTIPITEVHYSWKNKQGSYFVYGSDYLVYAPRYPQRCCWTCSIL